MFTFCRHYLKVLECSSSLEETTELSALFPLTRRDFGFKTCFPQFPAIAAWKQMASSGREGGRRVRPRNAADELLACRWTGSQTLAVTKSRKEGRLHSQKIFEVFETNLLGFFSPSLSVVPRVLSVRFLFQREIIACEGPFSQSDRRKERERERTTGSSEKQLCRTLDFFTNINKWSWSVVTINTTFQMQRRVEMALRCLVEAPPTPPPFTFCANPHTFSPF